MKLLRLTVQMMRAGYRAYKGTWWLMFVGILLCFGVFLYFYLNPFISNRLSFYMNMAKMNITVRLSGGGQTAEELQPVFELLDDSPIVHYYLLASPVKKAEMPLTSMSTVVCSKINPFSFFTTKNKINSKHGEPIDGYAYLSMKYGLEGTLNVNPKQPFSVDGDTFVYHGMLYNQGEFDMLVSNEAFARHQGKITKIIAVLSPLSRKSSMEGLKQQLAERLPKARIQVTFQPDYGLNLHRIYQAQAADVPYILGLVLACVLSYFILFRYLLRLRAADLAIARLVGGKRWYLTLSLLWEMEFYAAAGYITAMGLYSLYKQLFWGIPARYMFYLFLDGLPVLWTMMAFHALLALAAARKVTHSLLPTAGRRV